MNGRTDRKKNSRSVFGRMLFAAVFICIWVLGRGPEVVLADDRYVYDNANLMSEQDITRLEEACRRFEEDTKNHVVVLTAIGSGSEDPEAMADDFYDKKYPEDKDENGICLLIDMGQRQLVISTSGIMRYYLSDREIEDILDTAAPYATDGEYRTAFETMIRVAKECYDEGVGEGDYLIDENGKIYHYRKITLMEFCAALLAGIGVALIIYLAICRQYARKKVSDQRGYARIGDVRIQNRRDQLLDRRMITRRIPKDPPGGGGHGGSHGGGSSVHTGSSGRSHGGGSRGF